MYSINDFVPVYRIFFPTGEIVEVTTMRHAYEIARRESRFELHLMKTYGRDVPSEILLTAAEGGEILMRFPGAATPDEVSRYAWWYNEN